MTGPNRRAVILVGHGGVPTDYPRDLLTRLKTLEARRRATGGDPSPEETALDQQLRRWPRTPANDPYRVGLEALAAHLHPHLDGVLFALAYNEFCTPTVSEAVEALIAQRARAITVIPTMLTPGGSHSELEIPADLEALRLRHPGVTLRYAWPFDLGRIAAMLAEQVERFEADE